MIIADLQYFPPVAFFSASFSDTNVIFNEYDPYRKMSFRNRCLIAGPNNIIGLSIPIEGGRQHNASMKEIRVSGSEPWRRRHWRSLHSAYNRSPFFEHYAGELEHLYNSTHEFLVDWNQACMLWIKSKTGWPPEMSFSEAEIAAGQQNKGVRISGSDPVQDWRNRMLPNNYLDFPAPVYHQVFEDTLGFQANLSVLDLLFNAGPQAKSYLCGPAT